MSISYWTTDDIHRPADSNGFPTDPTSASLKLNVSGKTFDWYLGYEFSFQENSQTLNPAVKLETFVQSDTYYSYSEVPDLRMVVQVSINDFSSILLENILQCARTATSVGVTLYTREYQNIAGHSVTKTCQYRYYNATSISLPSVQSGSQYKIRAKMQYKNGSTWTDCQRTYASGAVWKTIIAYAPLYQSITTPSHFYANGINRFDATIYSYYKSNFSNIKFDGVAYSDTISDGKTYTKVYPQNIVRNPDPPYITEGTATSYLYFCPCLSTDYSHRGTYEFTAELSRVDPNDSNYYIPMAKRQVSGTVEYLAEDDMSMYGTPTWSIVDSKNSYNQYGVLLRNLIFECQLTVSETSRYGAPIKFSYKPINSSRWIDEYITDTQTKTVTIAIPEGTSSISLNAKLYGGTGTYTLLDIGSQVTIINYYMPSLPMVSIHRCDQDGSANDLGGYCRIDWAINVCPINNQNHKTLAINHSQGTTTYTNAELASYTQGGSLIVAANTESSYTITFSLTDDFNTTTKSLRLSTAHVTMDWLYNGKGVAFGKVSNQENALEVAEDWKLICYNLLFDNIDMNKWVRLIESRVKALEQFVVNEGSTKQFQVSFYSQDASELYARQWVLSGNNAVDPITSGEIDTPTKEPTTTKTYSFVGWSRSYPSSGATPGALDNITANRNIYAAFSTSDRTYSVNWFNGSTLLETDTDLSYHYNNASYGGTTPTREGYTFCGWMPSGKYIESNENAMAQFFEDVEIEDSWEEIMQAVDNGTAKSKYKQGNWKTLHTSEGDVPMRIMYFNKDTLAGSKATAKITWLTKTPLNNHKTMNPSLLDAVTSTETVADWIRTLETGKYIYTTNTKRKRSSIYPGTVTLTLRCNGVGTLKIGYKYVNSFGRLVIKVDGEEKYSGNGGGTSITYLEYACTAGQVFSVELIAHTGVSSDHYYAEGTDEKVVEISGTGTSNSVTLVQQSISTRIKTKVDHFIEGTGAMGGWRASQMRSWLNSDFLNGIDPVVRNKIKSVNKCSLSYKADDTVDDGFSLVANEITHDKIWIPSDSEIGGKRENESQGVDFHLTTGMSHSGLGYWRRTAITYSYYKLSDPDETHEADHISNVPRRFGVPQDVTNTNVSLHFGFCT